MEHLVGTTELRAEGRTVRGVVIEYGAVGDRLERFEPRALEPVGDTWFDIGHDRSRILAWRGAGLRFEHSDAALVMEATLPKNPLADFALDEIRSGRRRGLSMEMKVVRDRTERQTGVRVIERARMPGVGLVQGPSFPSSQVLEVRRKLGPPISGRLALEKPISCRCRDGCDTVRIGADAFRDAIEAVRNAERTISLFLTNAYGTPLAQTGTGGLMVGLESGALTWTAREGLPEIQAARDFLAQRAAGMRFYTRAYWPRETEVAEKVGTELVVTSAALAGIEVAAVSGATDGLLPVTFDDEERRSSRRRVWTL